MSFIPMSMEEAEILGYEGFDFILVSGDAYIDHPSFGVSIIGRILERHGFKVGIIAQPNWKTNDDFMQLGKPRLGFLVSAGNIDSMVNHYTVARRRRTKDNYTPNGEMGKRPDRATMVYGNRLREIYPDSPIIIGGIEASLRRLAHYDYWDQKVRRSILLDSSADLLIYGMAEQTIVDVAEALDSGLRIQDITYIRGTVYKTKSVELINDCITLPSYKTILKEKEAYAMSFNTQYENTDPFVAKNLIEPYDGWFVVQNQPTLPLNQFQIDSVYDLPYMRRWHPSYDKIGPIPAIEEVQFSLISNRGCFGGCNFCALTFHQGRIMQSRSHESIIKEAKQIIQDPLFKGYIHDVGGPTANFRAPSCSKQMSKGVCPKKQCLWPDPCSQLKVDHQDYLTLLRSLRALPKVKKVFVRSGIRYDYVMHDHDSSFFKELVQHHVSGQLKVAPEHINDTVLDAMGKPRKQLYLKFVDRFEQLNRDFDKNQYLVPYLMSSHPGSDLNAAIELAEYLRDIKHQPEQVQDFYPTPGTLSTAMFYTELDPRNLKPIYVPRTKDEKAMQRALIQYKSPKNYDLVVKALRLAGRNDLIGNGPKALVKPRSSYVRNTRYAKPYKKSTSF